MKIAPRLQNNEITKIHFFENGDSKADFAKWFSALLRRQHIFTGQIKLNEFKKAIASAIFESNFGSRKKRYLNLIFLTFEPEVMKRGRLSIIGGKNTRLGCL